VVAGAAYAAYDVVAGAATIEYEGTNAEEVARGMRAGSKGATSSAGSGAAGAGADFFFLVAFFLDFLEETAAAMPMQQHSKASRSAHATIGM